MSSKSQSTDQSQPSSERRAVRESVSAPPAELKQRLQAMSQVIATQRRRAWYQASWVPISTASLLVSVVGIVFIHQLTQQERNRSSLSLCEQFLAVLDAPSASSASKVGSHEPSRTVAQASWELEQGVEPSSQATLVVSPSDLPAGQLSLQVREFFAQHGAPSYFCLQKINGQDWRLLRCEVQQLGPELIAVRYFQQGEREAEEQAKTRVYTIKRDALCKRSLNQLQKFDQQRQNARLVENPCSVSVLLTD